MNTPCIIIPCMGRLAHLEHCLRSVIDRTNWPAIVVDYSCPDHCANWVESNFRDRVSTLRLTADHNELGKPVFNKCKAHNAGVRAAHQLGAEYICLLDADSIIESGVFEMMVLARLNPERFIFHTPSLELADLTGFLVVSTSAFFQAGGFDENFQGWGAEDLDLRLRLFFGAKLQFDLLPPGLLRSIPHDDALRTRYYQEQNKQQSHAFNVLRLVENYAKITGLDFLKICATPDARVMLGLPPQGVVYGESK